MRSYLALAASLLFATATSSAPAQPEGSTPSQPQSAPARPAQAPAPGADRGAVAQRAAGGKTERSDPRQGIVRLERSGQPLGYGLVLKGDGRIVTALSAVGHGNDIGARFSDGATLRASVVATDRKWDLALLSTSGAHWAPGLRPAAGEAAPGGPSLRRFRWREGRLQESAVVVEGRRPLIGRDGAVLDDMLVLQGRIEEDGLGSPLIDEAGEVTAVAVQACSPESGANCRMAAVGASVAVLKSFLKRAPAREPLPAAQLGFRGAAAHDGPVAGVRVIAVETASPAAAAGLRATSSRGASGNDVASGDLIVAVDDVPVTTPDELSEAINRAALSPSPRAATAAPPNAQATPGRQVRLLVYGSGKFREVALPLRPPPRVEMAAPPPEKPTAIPRAAPAPSPPAQPAPPSAPAAPSVAPSPPTNAAPSAPSAP